MFGPIDREALAKMVGAVEAARVRLLESNAVAVDVAASSAESLRANYAVLQAAADKLRERWSKGGSPFALPPRLRLVVARDCAACGATAKGARCEACGVWGSPVDEDRWRESIGARRSRPVGE